LSGINPQKKLIETFKRPHIPEDAEIAYEALRTGSERDLKLFLERGMLEWLIRVEYCADTSAAHCGTVKAVHKSTFSHDEMIILMANMMEVGNYGI